MLTNRGDLLVRYLANEKAFRGIGVARASALWRRFGEELPRLLDSGDSILLGEVVRSEIAEALVRTWGEKRVEGQTVAWLDRRGFDRRFAKRIFQIWGSDAVAKITENPYRMLAFASWENVDRISRRVFGIAADDERRHSAAVESACYMRLDRKHTLTDGKQLVRLTQSLLGCGEPEAKHAVALAAEDQAIVSVDGGWQPLGPAVMERFVAERIFEMRSSVASGQLRLLWRRPSHEEISNLVTVFRTKHGAPLTDEQAKAVRAVFEHPVVVITGGAGTGKTTVLACLHQLVERFGGRVIQMALAGRAARRMKEATGRDALTIAGFLKEMRDSHITVDDGTFIVIDESSMLDLPLTYRILTALQRAARIKSLPCRIVLLGDPNQIPPIGFGLVFHVLAKTCQVPRVELTKVHRQAEQTGIPAVADLVRRGIVPELAPYQEARDGVSFIEVPDRNILSTLSDVVSDLGGFDEARILAATKDGPAGVNPINKAFHEMVSPGRGRPIEKADFVIGEPVMHLVNDYKRRNLRNGSLGRVVEGPHGVLTVSFDDEGTHAFPVNELDKLALAFAFTVHKAQGSQFPRVVIAIGESRWIDRTWIYTAITRAEFQVVLVGSRSTFARSVVNPPSADLRQTGLKSLLTRSN
jgi:exodeoxyribonuclease V alpha subunit